jgi:hypothetical protein
MKGNYVLATQYQYKMHPQYERATLHLDILRFYVTFKKSQCMTDTICIHQTKQSKAKQNKTKQNKQIESSLQIVLTCFFITTHCSKQCSNK